ncbi:MAG: hypothetical protein WCO60_19715 [Verrucomicrobiota bacterium]
MSVSIKQVYDTLTAVLEQNRPDVTEQGLRLMCYDRREWLKPFLQSEKESAAEIEQWKSRAKAHEENYNEMLRRVDALTQATKEAAV